MIRPRPLQAVIGMAAGIALAGGGYAVAASTTSEIHACVNAKTRVLTMQARCPRGSRAVVWNVRGPGGRAGSNGKNGTNGSSVTLNSGVNVTEVSPSTPASASITQGSGGQDTLNLSIPQGATGSTGAAGASTGPNAYGEIWVGSSTAELAPGSGVGVADRVWRRRKRLCEGNQLRWRPPRPSRSSPLRQTGTAPTPWPAPTTTRAVSRRHTSTRLVMATPRAITC